MLTLRTSVTGALWPQQIPEQFLQRSIRFNQHRLTFL